MKIANSCQLSAVSCQLQAREALSSCRSLRLKADSCQLTATQGMTLVELLVAFVVLLMLVAALVSLTTRSLDVWTAGETRKDVYDRAQVVLDAVAGDLRNVYVETEVYDTGQQMMPPPAFACDLDPRKQPRIRFVRTGNPGAAPSGGGGQGQPAQNQARIIPPVHYGQFWELAYVMHPDPERPNVLCRGVKRFNRTRTGTLLNAVEYQNAGDALFDSCFTEVESGVLYVGYRFWTQYTTTWDDGVRIQKRGPTSRQPSGPETRWDSTRMKDEKFYFYRRRFDINNPDFVYPEIVQVVAVIETSSPDLHGVKVAEGCEEKGGFVRLSHTRGLADAPGMAKIEEEWIEYGGKTDTDLTDLKRGARGTKASSHPAGTAVRFGETFTTDVRLPVYREAQEP